MATKPEKNARDGWDKLDIILKFIGAVGTAVVLAFVGFFGSHFLARRQDAETDLRLYTELMSKREEADTSLRKEMFNSIITNFLKPATEEQPDKMVLNLELLAYNFHESLDLGPLFKDVYKKLVEKRGQNKESEQYKEYDQYVERLKKVTGETIAKQIAMLAEAGGKRDGEVAFDQLSEKPGGVTVVDEFIPVKSGDQPNYTVTQKQVRIEVLGINREKQELRVRLIVKTPPKIDDEADAVFSVGFFDFPMLDNVRLPEGHRCAIVLNHFEDDNADFTFVYFPGERASLKEKPYYDEIIYKLKNPQQP